jgi:beta-lactamase class A
MGLRMPGKHIGYGTRTALALAGLLAVLLLVRHRRRAARATAQAASGPPRPRGLRPAASLAGLALLAAVAASPLPADGPEVAFDPAAPAEAQAASEAEPVTLDLGRYGERLGERTAAVLEALREPPEPELSEPMARLLTDLETLVRELEGPGRGRADIAVAVVDLQSGEAISVDGDEQHLAGCTIKFFPALKAAHDVQTGARAFDASLEYLLQRTVRISNNADSHYLINLVGVPETNAFMTEVIGTQGSLITHAPGYYGENVVHGMEEPDNHLTADDLALAFSKLYRGELTTPELTTYLLDVMTQSWLTPPEYGVILHQAAPWGVRVSHKIGYVGPPLNVWNDAGVVMVDTDEATIAYAVAILTEGNDYYWQGPSRGRQIAERIFQHFNETYELGYQALAP